MKTINWDWLLIELLLPQSICLVNIAQSTYRSNWLRIFFPPLLWCLKYLELEIFLWVQALSQLLPGRLNCYCTLAYEHIWSCQMCSLHGITKLKKKLVYWNRKTPSSWIIPERVTLGGINNAGFSSDIKCYYESNFLPLSPSIHSLWKNKSVEILLNLKWKLCKFFGLDEWLTKYLLHIFWHWLCASLFLGLL